MDQDPWVWLCCFLGGGLEGVPLGALGCSTNAACLLFICFKRRKGMTHFLIHVHLFICVHLFLMKWPEHRWTNHG